MSIIASLEIWSQATDEQRIRERREQFAGPYRAMSAYNGDETKGERDWPWIVVGAAGVSCFGRLWPREYAQAVAAKMNA